MARNKYLDYSGLTHYDGLIKTKISEKAQIEHSSSSTTYGIGTTSLYGHVKLKDGELSAITTTSNGVVAASNHIHSQYELKANLKNAAYKDVDTSITTGTTSINVPTSKAVAELIKNAPSTGVISLNEKIGALTLSGHTYTPTGNISSNFIGNKTTVSSSTSYTPSGTVSSTFTGSATTISASTSYTPKGTVSQPTFTGSATTISASTNYTPAGTIESVVKSINPSTNSIYQITNVGSAALLSGSVSGEKLIISWTPNTVASRDDVTVVSEITSITGSPTFSGTQATISTSTNYTPAGTVSQPTFTGSAATISVSASYTPKGTVESTFTGVEDIIVSSGSTIPTGSIETTFSGNSIILEHTIVKN